MDDSYRHTRHGVYLIYYHFVWAPRRRRPVLVGAVADRLEALMRDKAAELGLDILRLAIRRDHVHIFIAAHPDIAPAQIAHRLKGYTARVLRHEFPHLLRLPSLWTHSSFVSTAGNVSAATIDRYIAAQSTRA